MALRRKEPGHYLLWNWPGFPEDSTAARVNIPFCRAMEQAYAFLCAIGVNCEDTGNKPVRCFAWTR